MPENNTNNNVYCSAKQITDDPAFSFITMPMLRYYLLHRHKNKLSTAVRKIGRKLLIRRDLFVLWLEEQK